MYKQLRFMMLVLIMASSFSAPAEDIAQKAPANIDFNQLIDSGQAETLKKDLDTKMQNTNGAQNTDAKKVLDFQDVEIGLGQERPNVDRRFNSVGAIRYVKLTVTE